MVLGGVELVLGAVEVVLGAVELVLGAVKLVLDRIKCVLLAFEPGLKIICLILQCSGTGFQFMNLCVKFPVFDT